MPNEFWVDLNAHVINRFGQDPGRSEKEIFDEYCRQKLRLDAVQTAKFARTLPPWRRLRPTGPR